MITALNTAPAGPICRWCGESIRPIDSGFHPDWVHTGPGGAFPCRDRLTGMTLPTFAAPCRADRNAPRAVGRCRPPTDDQPGPTAR